MTGDDSVHGVHEGHSHFQSQGSSQAKFKGHIVQVNSYPSGSFLQKSFFAHLSEHFQRQEVPFLSADSRHSQYLINDAFGGGRNLLGIFGLSAGVQAVLGGFGGGTLVETGLEVTAKGDAALELANRALDPKAKELAKLTQKTGMSETAMGATGSIFRGLVLASSSNGVNSGITAGTALGQSAFAFGQIGSVFSAVWYTFLGFSIWNSLKEVWRIEEGIKKSTDIKEFFEKELNFGPEETIKFLEQKFLEEHPECGKKSNDKETMSLLWNKEGSFNEWLENLLSKETKALAKDFLQSIHPNSSKTYDFDKAADTMLEKTKDFQDVKVIGEVEALGDLKLSQNALIGLESLHRNRLLIARNTIEGAIGSEALQDVLALIEGKKEKEAVLASVKKGLLATKTEDYVVAAFIALGAAITVAGTVGACIACPPLGLILACAIIAVFINVIISYVDLQSLMKTWDAPVGKLEDRLNTLKLLMGIGCIVGICLLSASTMGTFPVAVALVIVSSVVIISLWRYVHTHHKRVQEKEALGSMEALIKKLKTFKEMKTPLPYADLAEKLALEKKIQKIIFTKLRYTHKDIISRIEEEKKDKEWENRVTHITEQNITQIQNDIKVWQDAENAIIEELKEAFKELGKIELRDKSWKELFMQFFSDAPQFRRIFPLEENH